jgi:UDP-N-acetylmuramoylalanine--D-glutamate ligase
MNPRGPRCAGERRRCGAAGEAARLDVFVSDAGAIKPKYREELLRLGIEFEEGGHSAERVLGADARS